MKCFSLLQQHEARVGGKGNDAGSETAKQDGLAVEFGKYYALVIGNNEYRKLPKLQTAVDDARDVGKPWRNSTALRSLFSLMPIVTPSFPASTIFVRNSGRCLQSDGP